MKTSLLGNCQLKKVVIMVLEVNYCAVLLCAGVMHVVYC